MDRYLIKDQIYLITSNKKVKGEEIDQLPFDIFKDPIKLAVVYIRWSSADQSLKHSLSLQLNAVLAKARSLEYEVLVVFIEEETSAYHVEASKRKEMVKLKEFVDKNSNVDGIIFWKDSRVTRLIYDFPLQILIPLKNKYPELKVYSSDMEGEWDLNNPLVQIQAAMNHKDSEEKSFNSKNYHKSKLENKERPEGRPPYGYDYVPKDGIFKRNEHSFVVVFIFYLYSHGYSEGEICKLLEKSGIITPDAYLDLKNEKPPKPSYIWNKSSIRYILQNRWYIGDFSWFARESFHISKKKSWDQIDFTKLSYHEALIPQHLWEITNYFRELKEKKLKMSSPFILVSLIKCETCNVKLKTKNATPLNSKKQYLNYFCPSCKMKVKIDDIHDIVLLEFQKKWSIPLKSHWGKSISLMKSWIKKLRNKKETIKEQIEQIKFNEGMLHKVDPEIAETVKKTYEFQIQFKNKLVEEIQILIEQIERTMNQNQDEFLHRFKQNLDSYTNEELTSMLILTFDEILMKFEGDRISVIPSYKITPFIDLEEKTNYFAEI